MIRTDSVTNDRTPIKKALTNHPCSVKITLQVEDGVVASFEITNEADARNLLARLVPTATIKGNPNLVMEHVTDESQPLYDFLLGEGKDRDLSLPEGV